MSTKRMGQEVLTQKAADLGAAGSAFLAGSAWIADVEPIITAVAGIVAIIAGGLAAWYHYERARYMRNKNREESSGR